MKTITSIRIVLLVLTAITMFSNSTLAGSIKLISNQGTYNVNPQDSFDVQILIDADDATEGLQPLSNGLFSMGVKITFDSSKVSLLNGNINDIIQQNPPFDGDGAGGLPFKEIGFGYAEVAAAIPLSATEFYTGANLVTFKMKNLSATGLDPATLNFGLCFDSKANFVDGQGTTLDNQIIFGSATVVPEPATMFLLGLGSLMTLRRKA